MRARTQTLNQVHALLVSCDDDLRGPVGRLRGRHLASACAALSPDDGTTLALISLGRRWLTLHEEVATLDREIRKRVKATAPQLLTKHGVGIHTAAQLLITAGDNPDRLTHDAAFAALCAAPALSRHPPARPAATVSTAVETDPRTPASPPLDIGASTPSSKSFWGRVQTELLNRRRWKTRIELANALFEYLEIFHNRRRRHSALGMLTPIEYEKLTTTATA